MADHNLLLSAFLCLCCISITGGQLGVPKLQAVVNPDGTYEIKVMGNVWLKSAPIFFVIQDMLYSTELKNLEVSEVKEVPFAESDFGSGKEIEIHLTAVNETVNIVCSIFVYTSSMILSFRTRFPDGVTGMSHQSFDQVVTGFPGFMVENDVAKLAFLSFGGSYSGYDNQIVGKWKAEANIQDGLEGSSPLSFFDQSFNAMTIGTMDHFMSTSMWHDVNNHYLYWGVMSGVSFVPKAYEYKVLAMYASNVRESMTRWGNSLTTEVYKYIRATDIPSHNIGYWTGEGSYYFDGTEGSETYEDVLGKVFKEASDKSIPYKYIELDTWWFTAGDDGGVKEWKAPAHIFPGGIDNFHKMVKVGISAKSTFWSKDTVYAKQNGGDYDFLIEGDMALPRNQEFWDFLFNSAKAWGLDTYIQSNMTGIFHNFAEMKTNLTFAMDWLTQMCTSAHNHGVTVQFDDALPRMVMATLELPAVTQVRISPNYGAVNDQWKIGLTSIFLSGLKVSVSKDGFLSQVHENALGDPNAERQSLVSALSNGMFSTGDKANSTNTTIISRGSMKDGHIVRPDLPAHAIDAQLMQMAYQDGSGPVGQVWATYSTVTKLGSQGPAQTYGLIFASDLKGKYDITPSLAGLIYEYPKSKIFNSKDPETQFEFSEDKPFTIQDCDTTDYCLFYTSPVLTLNGREVLILGELNKWVPMSRQRITNVTVTDVITVNVKGAPKEKVEIWFALDGKMGALAIDIEDSGSATLVFEDNKFNSAHGLTSVPVLTAIITFVSLVWTSLLL